MHKSLALKKLRVAVALFAFLLASLAMLSSSYAWLAISRTPIVSDLNLTVMAESRLEIAMDDNGRPGEWNVVLDLSTLLDDIVPLRPVTYSKENNILYAPLFDVDGRPTTFTKALNDAENANVRGLGEAASEAQGYYIAVTFWVRGTQNAAISLSEAREVQEGLAGSGTYVIGNPVWDGEALSHTNGGNGLETAIRVGFRCQDTDLLGNPIGEGNFIVYEPNSDTHVDGSTGYVETTSMDGGSLVEESKLIRQTTSSWNETAPVLNDSVIYDLGDFENNQPLFYLGKSSMEKVTMYVWVEARDVDCINRAMGTATSIMTCIQLTSDGGYPDTGIERD